MPKKTARGTLLAGVVDVGPEVDRVLVAAVGVKDVDEGDAEGEEPGLVERERGRALGSVLGQEGRRREEADHDDLEDAEDVLGPGARLDAEVVDDEEAEDEDDRRDLDRPGRGGGPGEDDGRQVFGPDQGHAGGPGPVEDDHVGPVEHESQAGAVILGDDLVVAAGLGEAAPDLGEGQGADEADEAPEGPGGIEERRGLGRRGDHGRGPEDADADDQAHDDHRRVERGQLGLDGHARSFSGVFVPPGRTGSSDRIASRVETKRSASASEKHRGGRILMTLWRGPSVPARTP